VGVFKYTRYSILEKPLCTRPFYRLSWFALRG